MSVASDPQIRIERTFGAPREMVFAMWADVEKLARWFAPAGCTISYGQFDFRAGGAFASTLVTPDGYECRVSGRYDEIVPSERIVFTWTVAEDVPKDPEWPRETTVTVTFEDLGGKTRMTLDQNASEAVAKRTGAYPGWLSMFDRLAEELVP